MSHDQVWLVTGCSTGLGLALVKYLVSIDVKVIATARNPSSIASLGHTDKYMALPLDVTSIDQVKKAFQDGVEKFGKITHVVNNAGYGLFGEFEATSDDLARTQLEVNFWGVVNVCREALPVFREINKPSFGRLINVTSIGGFNGPPDLSFYAASKFAVEGFSESISREVDPSWNIRLTIAEPGGMETDWGGRSMIKVPPHPAYTSPTSPAAKFRAYANSEWGTESSPAGNTLKTAQALVELGNMEDPPLKLPLGTDAVTLIGGKLTELLEMIAKNRELSVSTWI